MELTEEKTSNITSKNNISIKLSSGRYQTVSAPDDPTLYGTFKNELIKKTQLTTTQDVYSPDKYTQNIFNKTLQYNYLLSQRSTSLKDVPTAGQTGWVLPTTDITYKINEEVADVHQSKIGWQKITNKELGKRTTTQYLNEETFINNQGQKLKATKVFEWSPTGYTFVTPSYIEPGKTYYMNFTTDTTTNNFVTPEHFTKLDIKNISNGVQLNFLTKEGYRYYIETSNDLINWTTIQTPPIIGGNNEMTSQLFGQDCQNSYYRLRIANFSFKPENFGISEQVEKLTSTNVSDKSIYLTTTEWLEKNNISNFYFSETDITKIKTSVDSGEDISNAIQTVFIESLANGLATANTTLCKELLNKYVPIPELIANKTYSLKSNTESSAIETKTISNIRSTKQDIPLDDFVMLRGYQMPKKQEEGMAKFVNYASFYEGSQKIYDNFIFFKTFKGYQFTPMLTINEFGKGTSNFSASYSAGSNNNISPAQITYERLPYFTINIKDDKNELTNTAFVKTTDGYYLYPANQKAGSTEYKETITKVIMPQLSNIYRANKDLNVLKTMLVLEESLSFPEALEKLTCDKQLNTTSQIKFNDNLTESHIKTLLSVNGNTTLSLESEPTKTYLTDSISRMFDKKLSFEQAKQLYSIIQEMYDNAIPLEEAGKIGNKSFLILHKLNEYIDKGMINAMTYSDDMAKNIEQLPKQVGTLASKTAVSLKDILINGVKQKLATVDYKVGNKTITYNIYMDETGKMEKIITSTDIAMDSTGEYFGTTKEETYSPASKDIQYVIKRIEQAMIGSGDAVLQELFTISDTGLKLNNPKAVSLINNTGNLRSADSEVFFVCKTDNIDTTNPKVTIIEDAKGCDPIAVKAVLNQNNGELSTNEGKIYLHKGKSLGSSEWQELSWNSIGQSNLNLADDGLTIRIQGNIFEKFINSFLSSWLIGMVGGWMLSLAKEALQGIEIAKQAMETLEWANNVQSTAGSFISPFNNAKNIVETIKNPQKMLSAYIPVEVKKMESELKNNNLEVRQIIVPLEKKAETLEKTKKEIENNYMPIIMVGNKIIQDTKKELVSVQAEIDSKTQSISTKAIADLEKVKERYEQQFGEKLTNLKEIKFELAAPISVENGVPVYPDLKNISNSIAVPEIMKEETIEQVEVVTENITSSSKLVEVGTISFDEYEANMSTSLTELKNGLVNPPIPNNTSILKKESNNKVELAVTDLATGTIFVNYDKKTNKLTYSPNTPSFYGSQEKLAELVKIAKNIIAPNIINDLITKTLKSLNIVNDLKKNIVHDSPRLTDDEMTKTLANMSDWIYKPDTGEKTTELQELLTAGFKPVYDKLSGHARLICNDTKTGYYGEFLVNDNTKTVVMVNRGTEVSNLNDYIPNYDLLLNKTIPNQVVSASNFYNDFKKNYQEYNNYKPIHTGHSLGGMIAQKIANQNHDNNGDEAVVFCAPGIDLNTNEKIEYIDNYVNLYDPFALSSISPINYYIEKHPSFPSILERHSIKFFKDGFQEAKLTQIDLNYFYISKLNSLMGKAIVNWFTNV